MFKKITSAIVSAAMLAGMTASYAPSAVNAADFKANYAEALQKSLYFYECQQAGPLPDWNRVEWRSDSTMIDEIKGGWYDAGDHVKFNLPMSYSASMLAWGLYQYPDGIEKCGEMTNYVNNLEFVLDYLADCDLGDEVVYQVGNGTIDHTWWGLSNFTSTAWLMRELPTKRQGRSTKHLRGVAVFSVAWQQLLPQATVRLTEE